MLGLLALMNPQLFAVSEDGLDYAALKKRRGPGREADRDAGLVGQPKRREEFDTILTAKTNRRVLHRWQNPVLCRLHFHRTRGATSRLERVSHFEVCVTLRVESES